MGEKTKYLLNGSEIIVVEQLQTGFLVKDIWIGYDDEEMEGEPYVVERIFDSPPTQKYDETILKLKAEIDDLRIQRIEIEKHTQKVGEQEKERLTKYQQYEQLKQLNDFLDGKITHYAVVESWTACIIPFEDALGEYRGEGQKLLTLFGKSDGNLCWGLNEYSDGSGCWRTVIPCTSYNQAIKELQKYVDAEAQNKPADHIIQLAKTYNLVLSDEYVARWNTLQRKGLEKQKTECQQKTHTIQERLDNLT